LELWFVSQKALPKGLFDYLEGESGHYERKLQMIFLVLVNGRAIA
jgi:hypothetical protein